MRKRSRSRGAVPLSFSKHVFILHQAVLCAFVKSFYINSVYKLNAAKCGGQTEKDLDVSEKMQHKEPSLLEANAGYQQG